MQCFCHRLGLLFQDIFKIIADMICFVIGIGGHSDRSMKLFGGHKPCYDRWPTVILSAALILLFTCPTN